MSSHIDALRLRSVMGRDVWAVPQPFGPDGWRMTARDGTASVIVTCSDHPTDPGVDWVHASIARTDRMPPYEDLTLLHAAVWGSDGWAYQVFAPRSAHVNIHEHALHLWGRLDGTPALPEFGIPGLKSI